MRNSWIFLAPIVGLALFLIAPELARDLESRRLQDRVSEELSVKLDRQPDLIDFESFGGIEEGGDRALMRLSSLDCDALLLTSREFLAIKIDRQINDLWASNRIVPLRLMTRELSNDHGDHTLYQLDPDNCILFREYYFE